MKKAIILISSIVLLYCSHASAAEARKTFIKGFITDNVSSVKRSTAENIFTSVLLDSGYMIISMESLNARLSMEELKMALGSNDEKNLKDVMSASEVDYIVYGTIRSKAGYTFITVKMLDKSHGSAELGRIKTLRIKSELESTCYDEACRVLACFLVNNDAKAVQKFQDQLFSEEKRFEKDKRDSALKNQEYQDEQKFRASVESYKRKRKRDIAGRYAFIRMAYNFYGAGSDDDNFNDYFKDGTQFFFEMDVPMNRTELSGMDMLFRYTVRYYAKEGDVAPANPEYADYWNEGQAVFNSFDFGLRYRMGFYVLMTKFDLYALAALRYTSSDFSGVYGFGFEIAFFPSYGFFVEYNRGKSDIGVSSLNIETNQVLIGLTVRI